MKKALTIIAILILTIKITFGQNKISVNLNFTLQYVQTTEDSKLQLNKIFNFNYSSDFKLGYKFQKIQFKTGIIYSKQKQTFNITFNFATEVSNRELIIDLTYLKIPFYINYDIMSRNNKHSVFTADLKLIFYKIQMIILKILISKWYFCQKLNIKKYL